MRIKEILKEQKLTAKNLAEMINMTEEGLCIALNAKKGNPTLKTLKNIADALEVPITELFEKEKGTKLTANERHLLSDILYHVIEALEYDNDYGAYVTGSRVVFSCNKSQLAAMKRAFEKI